MSVWRSRPGPSTSYPHAAPHPPPLSLSLSLSLPRARYGATRPATGFASAATIAAASATTSGAKAATALAARTAPPTPKEIADADAARRRAAWQAHEEAVALGKYGDKHLERAYERRAQRVDEVRDRRGWSAWVMAVGMVRG